MSRTVSERLSGLEPVHEPIRRENLLFPWLPGRAGQYSPGSGLPPGMETVPKPLAIVRANRYMIDNNDYLIACAWRLGNARELVEYAQSREKRGRIYVKNLTDKI